MKASCEGHVECVNLLLGKGAEVNDKDEVSAVAQSFIVCLACSEAFLPPGADYEEGNFLWPRN